MDMKKKHILVTGGAGFIGSHCVDLLLGKDHTVKVLDNLSTGLKNNLNLSSSNLEFIEGDMCNEKTLAHALKDITHVLHLAARVSVNHSVEFPLDTLNNNILGFANLLSFARNKNIRIVYASSAAIYGAPTQALCSENIAKDSTTLSPYALSKKQNEEMAGLFHHLYGMSLLGLRFFNAYGPGQLLSTNQYGVIAKFIDDAINNQTLIIDGDGEQTRDFIFVKDIAHACNLALFSDYNGILNIASGKSISINQLVQEIGTALGRKLTKKNGADKKGQIKHSVADIIKAKEKLNFYASTDMQQGLQSTIDSLGRL